MKLDEIPAGTEVFIDANIFVYAFAADQTYGAPCIDFLERVELGVIDGFISAPILSEVAHRLMTLEACQTFGWPYPGIAQRLRRHLDDVQTLQLFRQALAEIAGMKMTIHPVSDLDVRRAADLSQQYGLLSNDALVVSVMQDHSLGHLASNDQDFDRVPNLSRYAPG